MYVALLGRRCLYDTTLFCHLHELHNNMQVYPVGLSSLFVYGVV